MNESPKLPRKTLDRAWKLFLSMDKMLFHTSDAKRTNNTSLTKAIRTRIVQIEAGNKRTSPNRTTKPRTDPTAATDKLKGPFNSSSQLWKTGTDRERASWSRASEEWHLRQTSRETGPNSTSSPKRRPATPRPPLSPPFLHRRRQTKLAMPAPARHQVFPPPTEPRDMVVEGMNIGRG